MNGLEPDREGVYGKRMMNRSATACLRPPSRRPRLPLRSALPAWAALALLPCVAWWPAARAQSPTAAPTGSIRVSVTFVGGYDTDPRDHGRPVALVAGALGVPPEVFRAAFTHVHPAPAGSGGPSEAQARDNKRVLMDALAPYGITNERLDAVSDQYRYARSRGERWPTRPAAAYATVENGRVTGFVVTDGGCGYNSPPTVAVPGANGVAGVVRLVFGPDFEKNGSVAAINLPHGN